jgi:hypothetical protein
MTLAAGGGLLLLGPPAIVNVLFGGARNLSKTMFFASFFASPTQFYVSTSMVYGPL